MFSGGKLICDTGGTYMEPSDSNYYIIILAVKVKPIRNIKD